MKKFFFDFFRWLAIIQAYPVQWLFYKRKTYYEEGANRRMWKKGGALIISNHYSFFDYPLTMFLVLPRKLNVVSSEIPYKNKFLSFGMNFFGGIQANRLTKDMSFMNKSAEVIRRGQLVQIYPEGRITTDGNLQPFKRSYIVIAHRANAPIIPIVTDGNYGFFKRTRLMVGKEIYVSDYINSTGPMPTKDELVYVDEIIHNKVQSMLDQLNELKDNSKKKNKRKGKNK